MQSRQEGWTMWSMHGGLQTLAEALVERLNECNIVTLQIEEPCTSLRLNSGKFTVETPTFEIEANHVFSTLPARSTNVYN